MRDLITLLTHSTDTDILSDDESRQRRDPEDVREQGLRAAHQRLENDAPGDRAVHARRRARRRLVKGAYKESSDIAFDDKADVDRNFERLAERPANLGFFVRHLLR